MSDQVHQIKFSMNGFRRSMHIDAVDLRHTIQEFIDDDYCSLEDLKKEFAEKFDALACAINSLCCIYDENDENFNDLSDELEVQLLGDYE